MRLDEARRPRCSYRVRFDSVGRRARAVVGLFPLTGFGLATAGAGVALAAMFAGPRRDYVLQVVAGAALMLVVFSAAGVGLMAFAFRRNRARRQSPEIDGAWEAEQGYLWGPPVPTPLMGLGFRVRIDSATPPVRIDVLPDPAGTWRERISANRRGERDRIQRRVHLEDPFGLARLDLDEVRPDRVRIQPWRGRLNDVPEVQAFRAGDLVSHPDGRPVGDRMDLRPYQLGDPLRWAAWKIYARTGELLVRVPETSVEPEHRWAAFLVGDPADEAAAALAWLALEEGFLGEQWCFGADGDPDPTEDLQDALRRVLRTEHREGGDLPDFVEAACQHAPARLLLFAPPKPGPWIDAVEQVRRRCSSATVIMVHDGEGPSAPNRWYQRPPAQAEGRIRPRQLRDCQERLEALGVRVLTVNRSDPGTGSSPRVPPVAAEVAA